jgi:molecular chaperone GrpE
MANETDIQEDADGAAIEQYPDVALLEKALEEAQAALAEANDKSLRTQADAENMRRRARLDIENAHKFSVEKLAKELVHVIDSLEKGLEAAGTSTEQQIVSMKEGMELTHKLLLATLEKFHIHQVNPQGAVFDPKQHEALTTQVTTDVPPNTVLTVVQKGFVIHDRVLRPARVIVAKAP